MAGGVAVLTGSAAGIGYAMAKRCHAIGMHVVLSDVRQEPLDRAIEALRVAKGGIGRVEGFICDVASLSSVQQLLASVQATFANVPIQFLAANAGVLFSGSTILSGTPAEWETTYRVNVLGAYHTLQTFVPIMCSQPSKSVVEITGSAAGVVFGGTGPYGPSKLAVVGIAEGLWSELNALPGSALERVSIVVLCPALVKTDLLTSGEQAVGGAVKAERVAVDDVVSQSYVNMFKTLVRQGMSPDYIADEVFRHAQSGKFYCILDNNLERDGFEMGLYKAMEDRFSAMRTGDLATHKQARFTAKL